MEDNTNDNGNVRKGKSVRFNQEPQVFVFESQSNDVGELSQMTKSPVTRPEQGSVRERARKYDQNVAWRSIPLHPRPPALPPRNPVQVPVNRAAPKPLPPKPPPRAKNDSTVVTNVCQKVRIFRRCPDTQPATEELEVVPLVPHYRMRVPDTPPPPPPSLMPSAAAKKSTPPTPSTSFTPSTPSTSSTPSTPSTSSTLTAPSVDDDDDDDNGIRLADLPNTAQADGTTAADGDNEGDKPGCLTGCFMFFISCFSSIVG